MRRILGKVGVKPARRSVTAPEQIAPEEPTLAEQGYTNVRIAFHRVDRRPGERYLVIGDYIDYRSTVDDHIVIWHGIYDSAGTATGLDPEWAGLYAGPFRLPPDFPMYRNVRGMHPERVPANLLDSWQYVGPPDVETPRSVNFAALPRPLREDAYDIESVHMSRVNEGYYRVMYSRTLNGHNILGCGFFHVDDGERIEFETDQPHQLNVDNLRAVYIDATAPRLRILPKPPVPVVFTSVTRVFDADRQDYLFRVYGAYDNRNNVDEDPPSHEIFGNADFASWDAYYDASTGRLVRANSGPTPPDRINLRTASRYLDAHY